eukprot:COSAG01_NODE_6_length_54687_cov_500.907599_9_plen_459_part_00
MIEIDNLEQVAAQIESERGISKSVLFSAIEQALISACKKKYDEESTVEAALDTQASQLRLYFVKTVVDDVDFPFQEISLEEATKIDADKKIDDTVHIELSDPDFGRYAAQVARQVIIQRLREEEKVIVYDYFKEKEGQLISGTVQSIEKNYYLLNLGKTEAILSFRDCIPNQNFTTKEVIKVYLVSIEQTQRRPIIRLSRTHSGFLQAMLTQEIPEIQDGIIEIKSISRQAGERAKVAVISNNSAIGAVGTCVGPMGGRIQNIIEELGNKERIDILEWDENVKTFISNSLKPAKISRVLLLNEEEKRALVVTENEQLSLAIGKQGQNIRLSSRLTGWHLDVTDEANFDEKMKQLDVDIATPTLAEKMTGVAAETPSAVVETKKTGLSLSEKIAQSSKEMAGTQDKPESLISVAELAKELGLKTAKALIEKVDGRVEIANARAKLDASIAEQIRELLNT